MFTNHWKRAQAMILLSMPLQGLLYRSELTITEMREQLKDLGNEIKAQSRAVFALTQDSAADPEAVKAKMGELTANRERYDTIKAACDNLEEMEGARIEREAPTGNPSSAAGRLFHGAGDFFRAVSTMVPGKAHDPRIDQVAQIRSAATGQNIGTDADGGYLVPPEYADGILKLTFEQATIAADTEEIPISSNRLIVNKLKDENRTDGQRSGGIQAYWTGEAEQYTASKAQFEQDQTDLHKLTGLCYATDEMLQDDTAMSAFIQQAFAEEFAFKINDVCFWGNGSGQPVGVLDAKNKALITVPKESGQATRTVVFQNILKMYNAMPAANRAKAKWYINQDIELLLMQLFMTNTETTGSGETAVAHVQGVPIWVPAGGLASAPNGSLLGRPVLPTEHNAAVGSKGDILFADMSQYRRITKGGMDAQTSMHVRFDYGEQAFRFTLRMGGKPKWTKPITPYKGTTERSPFVTLATRG